MNFNDAYYELHQVKECIRRKGWPKGTFLYEQIPAVIDSDVIPKMTSVPESAKEVLLSRSNPLSFSNQINIVDSENNATAYIPSVEDINAFDWEVLSVKSGD